ncbi:hypothetical protein GWE18_39345 [Bradyrhizobium sp. CSA112]|nr:hypothetical protein [Bradyrhizobium sp. CSA112]
MPSPFGHIEIHILQRPIPTKQRAARRWQTMEQKPCQSPNASAHRCAGSWTHNEAPRVLSLPKAKAALVWYLPTCCEHDIAHENARQLAASRLPKSCDAAYWRLDLAPEALLRRFVAALAPARKHPKLVAARPHQEYPAASTPATSTAKRSSFRSINMPRKRLASETIS